MRIFRISNMLSLVVATCFGVLLFWTSQAVQVKEEELSRLKEGAGQEKEAMRVLGAEWAYLNRPQRLEKLAKEQLGMELPPAAVLKAASDIPEPVSEDVGFPEEMVTAPVAENTQPAIAQTVSAKVKAVVAAAPVPAAIVSPSKAEKQSFDKLIDSLNGDGATP